MLGLGLKADIFGFGRLARSIGFGVQSLGLELET